MSWIEKFRDNHPEGYEVWSWSSDFKVPYWDLSVWVSLDSWALGVDTEVDPGGYWKDAERRRFTSLHIGPASIILTHVTRSKCAA